MDGSVREIGWYDGDTGQSGVCRPGSEDAGEHELRRVICPDCGKYVCDECVVCGATFVADPEEEWCDCGAVYS